MEKKRGGNHHTEKQGRKQTQNTSTMYHVSISDETTGELKQSHIYVECHYYLSVHNISLDIHSMNVCCEYK